MEEDGSLPPRKSLYEYCKISYFERAPKAMKNLIVEQLVGCGGWWYKKAALPFEMSPHSLNEKPAATALHPVALMAVIAHRTEVHYPNVHAYSAAVWNIKRKKIERLLPHATAVLSIVFNPKGTLIATGTEGDTAHIWDLDGNNLRTLQFRSYFKYLAFNSQGTSVSNGTTFWQFEDEHENNVCKFNINRYKRALAHHPKHPSLVAAAFKRSDKSLHESIVILLESGKQSHRDMPFDSSIDHVAFTANGDFLFMAGRMPGSYNNTVYQWDLVSDRCKHHAQFSGTLYDMVGQPTCRVAMQDSISSLHAIRSGACADIRIGDLKGNSVRLPCSKYAWAIKFNQKGNAVLMVVEDELVVWQQHEKPTLEQVLLRQALKNYLMECIAVQECPSIMCMYKSEFVDWMYKHFYIRREVLQEVWESMPEELQESLFNTFKERTSAIFNNYCWKYAIWPGE